MTEDIKEITEFVHNSFTNISESSDNFDFMQDYEVFSSIAELISISDQYASLFGSIIIRETTGSRRFFELSGGEIRQADGFDEVDQEVYDSVDIAGFQRYRNDNYEVAAEHLRAVCDSLSEEFNLKISGILRKRKIEEELAKDLQLESQTTDFDVHYWKSPQNLNEFLSHRSFNEAIELLFEFESSPIFVFYQGGDLRYGSSVVCPLENVEELELQKLVDEWSQYRSVMDAVQTGIDWGGDLSPIHPDPVATIQKATSVEYLHNLHIYSILCQLSKSVRRSGSNTDFLISHDPEFRIQISDVEISEAYSEELLQNWEEISEEFQEDTEELEGDRNENAFRDIWQQAIAEIALEGKDGKKKIQLVSDNTGQIRETVQKIQREIVVQNFEGLSDALDETQSLMASITSRLSDATSESARQFQALGFTLLGAIIANVFLVLRWSQNRMVVPFTMGVLVIIAIFYLPLIQGRINDLDSTIEEADNDFDLYQRRIRQFNKDLFRFSELKDRVDAYTGIAENQRDRAQVWTNLTFHSIFILWCLLAVLSVSISEVASISTAITLASIVLFSMLLSSHDYSPSDRKYFDSRAPITAIVVGLFVIISKLVIS